MASAPAFTARLASGTSAVITIAPAPDAPRDPIVRLVHAGADDHALDQRAASKSGPRFCVRLPANKNHLIRAAPRSGCC